METDAATHRPDARRGSARPTYDWKMGPLSTPTMSGHDVKKNLTRKSERCDKERADFYQKKKGGEKTYHTGVRNKSRIKGSLQQKRTRGGQ